MKIKLNKLLLSEIMTEEILVGRLLMMDLNSGNRLTLTQF